MDAQVPPKQPGDPRRLGPYELLGRLGQGGMGVVFLGRDRHTGQLAAVKALRPELAGDPSFAARFHREVEAARRVDSPCVARVVNADPSADRPWLATEYVGGSTLATAVATGGPLTGERLLDFATGVAQALTAIHTAGVVHRDLKPTNILLQGVDRPLGGGGAGPHPVGVKVIDFGIAWAADATMTRSGLRFGTPSWMAPEQLRDQPVGPPADVFAWGTLVTFAATGRHPFGGGPPDAVAYRILHGQPDLEDVPQVVRPLVRDALSRDPAARPTAPRIAALLAPASPPTLPLPAGGPTWVAPTRRLRRRRVGGLLVAGALLVGLVTAPHVVLAAVEGPADPSTRHQHPSKQGPDDEEDGPAAEDKSEERDREQVEEAEEAEEREEVADEGEERRRRRGRSRPGPTSRPRPTSPPATQPSGRPTKSSVPDPPEPQPGPDVLDSSTAGTRGRGRSRIMSHPPAMNTPALAAGTPHDPRCG